VTKSWPPDRTDQGEAELPDFDPSVASPARIWDYWLGGKDNFAADREAGEKAQDALPSMPVIAQTVRRFLADTVRRLSAGGIRQFLDIGTGLPTADNTHEVAQRAAPESRIVYVDNDPIVTPHARALLASSAEGETSYVHADLRDTAEILAAAARTLDFSRPVAVMLIAVLHFIPDADDPFRVVARLMDAVPAGSYLVVAHAASDISPDAVAKMTGRYNQLSSVSFTARTGAQVARFFDGLDLLEPGVAPLQQWAPGLDGTAGALAGYGAVGVKR
jgi:hypothetical protein